jgi:hypothetical protein
MAKRFVGLRETVQHHQIAVDSERMEVITAGFDIRQSAQELEAFYLSTLDAL